MKEICREEIRIQTFTCCIYLIFSLTKSRATIRMDFILSAIYLLDYGIPFQIIAIYESVINFI